MTSERIKELHLQTAYPESRSVHQALLQVWNECEQDSTKYSEEVQNTIQVVFEMTNKGYSIDEIFEQFKK